MTLRTIPVTIPAGKSMSNAADCSGSLRIVRMIMPPDWTFASLTFQMSPDGVEFHDLRHVTPGSLDSHEVTLNFIEPNAVLAFPPTTGASVGWIKIRSGTHATPVKQVAERVFQVVVEDATVAEGPTGPAGAAGAKGATGPTGTFDLKGTTTGEAAAPGNIGELLVANNAGGVSLTTAITANVCQLLLPAGSWLMSGIIIFNPVGTGPNSILSGLSTVSGAMPSDAQVVAGSGTVSQVWSGSLTSGKPQSLPTGMSHLNITTPTNIFLVAQSTFGGGSVTAIGRVTARRVG